MLRLTHLSNKYQKRLIRPIYAQTQATPYATSLDEQTLTAEVAPESGTTSFKNPDGSRRLPKKNDESPLAKRTADAYTLKGSLTPGLVMVRTVGETVAVGTGVASTAEQPFGLLANFIGGELDDLGDEDQVGVWRGANHAFFELLKPAWDDTELAEKLGEAAAKVGGSVYLGAAADGRLKYTTKANEATPGQQRVARVIDRPSASRILIELLV